MGMPCQLLDIPQYVICRYGDKSTGPRTQAGRDKLKQLQLKHGKYTKEKRLASKKRAEIGRKLGAVIKQTEMNLIDEDVFDRNWRKDWELLLRSKVRMSRLYLLSLLFSCMFRNKYFAIIFLSNSKEP